MSCSITLKGIGVDCSSSMGGIKKAYIAEYPTSGTPYTISEDGVVTAINANLEWLSFNFKKNTGSLTSTLNVDAANGINYVSTEVVLQFTKMETSKRVAIAALALSDVCMIVEDSNGVKHALGASEPVNVTSGTAQTGTAKGDGNFYQITMTDEHTSFLPILSDDVTITPIG